MIFPANKRKEKIFFWTFYIFTKVQLSLPLFSGTSTITLSQFHHQDGRIIQNLFLQGTFRQPLTDLIHILLLMFHHKVHRVLFRGQRPRIRHSPGSEIDRQCSTGPV